MGACIHGHKIVVLGADHSHPSLSGKFPVVKEECTVFLASTPLGPSAAAASLGRGAESLTTDVKLKDVKLVRVVRLG